MLRMSPIGLRGGVFHTSLAMLNKGKVVSWVAGRGFGFVEDEGDQKQYFVHFSSLKMESGGFQALSVGQAIEYDLTTDKTGRTRAERVTSVGGAPLPSGPRPAEGDRPQRGGFQQNSRPRRWPRLATKPRACVVRQPRVAAPSIGLTSLALIDCIFVGHAVFTLFSVF